MEKLKLNIQYFATGPTMPTISQTNVKNKDGIITGVKYTITSTDYEIDKIESSNGGTTTDVTSQWEFSSNSYVATKTYTENTTETIAVNFGGKAGGTAYFNIEVNLTGLNGEISYGYCGSKCKHPVYTRTEIESKFLNGTTAPAPDLGEEGDMYFMYDEEE